MAKLRGARPRIRSSACVQMPLSRALHCQGAVRVLPAERLYASATRGGALCAGQLRPPGIASMLTPRVSQRDQDAAFYVTPRITTSGCK